MEHAICRPEDLEASLLRLHADISRLIAVLQEHADGLADGEAIRDKLPLLDFYNDDLLRSVEEYRRNR